MDCPYRRKNSPVHLPARSLLKEFLSSKRILFYIFLLSFIVRLFIGLRFSGNLHTFYWRVAKNIVSGRGLSLNGNHPTAHTAPVYPLILAGIMAIFGEGKFPVIVVLALVGAINAVLCGILSREAFGEKSALGASLIYAFIPYLATQESMTEQGLVTLGLISSLYFLFKGYKSKKLIFMAACGIMLSFTCLVRSDIALIPFYIFLSLFVSRYRSNKTTRWHISAAALFILAFAIGVSPWFIRNRMVFGRPYLGDDKFWVNFYVSNHARTFEIYPQLSLDNFRSLIEDFDTSSFANEADLAERLRQRSLEEMRKRSLKENAGMFFKKFIYLWDVRIVPYKKRIGNDPLTGASLDRKRSVLENLAFSLPYVFLLIFTCVGCWEARKRKRLLIFIAGFLLTFSIPYMAVRAFSRYTTCVYFVLIMLASHGLVTRKTSLMKAGMNPARF